MTIPRKPIERGIFLFSYTKSKPIFLNTLSDFYLPRTAHSNRFYFMRILKQIFFSECNRGKLYNTNEIVL